MLKDMSITYPYNMDKIKHRNEIFEKDGMYPSKETTKRPNQEPIANKASNIISPAFIDPEKNRP